MTKHEKVLIPFVARLTQMGITVEHVGQIWDIQKSMVGLRNSSATTRLNNLKLELDSILVQYGIPLEEI